MPFERGKDVDRVTRAWEGKTVVCVATGPSLTAEQVALVRSAREVDAVRVIAVNDAFLVAPWADVLFHADAKWHEWHIRGQARSFGWARFTAAEAKVAYAGFKGERCSVVQFAVEGEYRLGHKDATHEGLSTEPSVVCTGRNSGHIAMNIAVLAGGSPILLVGYDAKRGAGERKHVFGDHEDKTEPPYREMVLSMRAAARKAAALGVQIVNCTPGSAIDAFEKRDLAEALCVPTA